MASSWRTVIGTAGVPLPDLFRSRISSRYFTYASCNIFIDRSLILGLQFALQYSMYLFINFRSRSAAGSSLFPSE